MESLDRETKDLLISLGIDIDGVQSEEERGQALPATAARDSISSEKDENEACGVNGNTRLSKMDEEKENDAEKRPHVESGMREMNGQKKSFFKKKILTSILMSASVAIAFLMGLSCSKQESGKQVKITTAETIPCFFLSIERREGGNSIAWLDSFPAQSSSSSLFLQQQRPLAQELFKRRALFESRLKELASLADHMKDSLDPSYLIAFQSASKRLIHADVVTGASIAAITADIIDNADESEQFAISAAFEEMGLSERSIDEYLQIKDKADEILEEVDQACDLLSDEGEDITYLATTLEAAMNMLDELEHSSTNPIFMAAAQLIDIPVLRQKLIDACSDSIDLLIQERLSIKESEKLPFSFQEMKAIALLLSRMPSKGDRSRLQALEAIEEAAYRSREEKGSEVERIESSNLLDISFDESRSADKLSVAITYPCETVLY